jgi:serine/threonine protein kinase
VSKENLLGLFQGVETFLREIMAHWILEECEGVLNILGLYDNEEHIILALEYQAKGSLMQSLKQCKKFSELEVRFIMQQILLVLDFFQ